MNDFLSGVILTMGSAIGLFYVRFWRKTRDALFAFFAASFFLMAGTRGGLFLLSDDSETRTTLYVLRLIAFVLIIVAIVQKNRAARRERVAASPEVSHGP